MKTTMCPTLTTPLAGQAVLVDVERKDEGGLQGGGTSRSRTPGSRGTGTF